MRKFFTLLTLSLLSVALFANKQISGDVVDEKGEPVIGASIQVLGTTLGTITDLDGLFEISVPDDATQIKVTSIGMDEQTLEIKKVMHIVMTEHTEQLQEVVTIGYGTVTKGSYTGSAQGVDAETIDKKAPTEATKALAGEIAGVQVINSSGQPGTNATLVIRGYGSLHGSRTPLYVVDGMPYEGDISSIDPSDIASLTVLKDATATSLYGSRGANGVVVITTKKGSSGDEGKIDIDVKYGANMRLLPLYDVISTPEDYVLMSWQSIYNYNTVVAGAKNPEKSTNNMLFGANGIPTGYNLWDQPGNTLVYLDSNGKPKFDENATRRKGYESLESWKDAIFRVGQKLDASVKFHGGTEKVRYYASLGYLKDEGYYQSSDYDRFSIRSNIDYEPKKWLKGTVNIAYAYSHMNYPDQSGDGAMNNGFYYVNACPAIYPVYMRDANGNIPTDSRTGLPTYDYGNELMRSFGMGINPAGSLRLDKENTTQHEVDANGALELKFGEMHKKLKGLKFQLNAGMHYLNALASELTNPFYGDAAGVGRIAQQSANYFIFDVQELITYNNTFGDHTIDIMVGHENLMYKYNYMTGYKSYTADPYSLALGNAIKMNSIGGNFEQFALDSYFAKLTYSLFDNRYVLSATYRADGSSRYAPGHRWGHFGSVGAAWGFTDEPFMADAKEWLKKGKLRLSWGVLGNQVSSLYSYTDLYSIDNVNDRVGYIWGSKGNPEITWERTNQTDLGLELSIGKYLDMEFDYFYKLTDNLFMTRAMAPSLGYSSMPTNEAKMLNQGVEFTFNAHAVNERNVKLDIRLNGSHYNNKMLQMPVDYIAADGTVHRQVMNGPMAYGHSILEHYTTRYLGVDPNDGAALYEGYAWNEWIDKGVQFGEAKNDGSGEYNYVRSLHQEVVEKIMDEKNCKPEDVTDAMVNDYVSKNLTKVSTKDYDLAASQYVGKSYMPAIDGGLGIDLDVYGVTLSIATSYRIGGYGYDATYMSLMDDQQVGVHNWHVDMLNSWTENNRNTDIPGIYNGAAALADKGPNSTYVASGSTRFLTSNSFFSLNNIQIGYNFPKKLIEKAKMERLHLFVSANNLAIVTARRGYNPMTSFTGTSDTHGYSPLSTIMGGIKVSF